MIYALIILGTLFFTTCLIIAEKKFPKALPTILKSLAVIFFLLFFFRIWEVDVFDAIKIDNPFFTKTMTVFMVILRALSLSAVLIVTINPFFKVKTLKNLTAFFGILIYIPNLIFLKQNLIAFQGVLFSYTNYRAILFSFELALLGMFAIYYLYEKFATKDFKNFKEQAKYMAIVLPLVILSAIHLSTFSVLNLNPGEADELTLTHRLMLYIPILAILGIYAGFKNKDYQVQKSAIMIMSLAGVVQFCYTYHWRTFYWTNLPFHLCNTGVFLMFFAFTFKNKSVFYFTYLVNVLGAMVALLMPNTSGHLFQMENLKFWYYHIYDVILPVLAVMFGHFKRPNLKHMRGAIAIFTGYFILMIITNAYVNTFDRVDYFFLYGDEVSSRIKFLETIRINYQWIPVINGVGYKVYWLYDILIYVGYIFLMFMIWLVYTAIYKTEDHYKELFNLRKQDVLEIKKFKKLMNGRPLTSPVNPEGVNMIKITNFSKVYGHNKHKTVDNFNLEVYEGEVFGFIGHNGAGKSTVIKSMVGIQSITEGSIEICGYEISKQPLQAKLNIGYVSDNHAVYENLTGREYVNYVADLFMVSKKDRDERLEKYANMFNLTFAIDQQIKSYSHGMKQKLVVIAALIHNPKVWILDEPLTGLDPSSAYQIKECMREHANNGNIVFFSSHVIEVIEKICDRIAIINKGKLEGVFNVKELLEKGIDLEELYLSYVEQNTEKQKELLKIINSKPSKKEQVNSKKGN